MFIGQFFSFEFYTDYLNILSVESTKKFMLIDDLPMEYLTESDFFSLHVTHVYRPVFQFLILH